MEATDARMERATLLFQQACRSQMNGNLAEAMRLYKESIQTHPTAEAHTGLGWLYGFLNKYEDAITECKLAIAVDPEFGNPYNDIGSYLLALGRPDAAVPWLEGALESKRYEPRHRPHINFARVHLAKGQQLLAAREFGKALEIEPRSLTARRGLAALSALLN